MKVTDFGIARAVAEASMTVTGTTLGSVHYFSPEQARGDEVTGQSDVYALGIVLYEMLTGRRPFEGDSAAGVALKRLDRGPAAARRSIGPVPPGLSAIVMRALERDPANRFPDAGAFAEALRVWQRNPDAAPAPRRPRGGRRPRSRRPASRPSTSRRASPCRPTGRDLRHAAGGAGRRLRAADGVPEPRATISRGGSGCSPCSGILLLGTIGFLAASVLGGLGPNATPTPTPSRLGISLPELRSATRSPASAPRRDDLGLVLDRADASRATRVAVDTVISTDPAAGTERAARATRSRRRQLRARSRWRCRTCSARPGSEATTTLTAAGLVLGRRDRAEPSGQPAGAVIRSEPDRRRAGRQGEPGRHRAVERPDAVPDAIADAGPDPDADAGADANADADPRRSVP